jgi:hypothetical protein
MADDHASAEEQNHLALLAYQLEDDRRFMAYVLHQYRQRENLTEQDVIERLRTTPEMLVRLALCKRLNNRSPQFIEQLQQLAAYTEINIEQLRTLIQKLRD